MIPFPLSLRIGEGSVVSNKTSLTGVNLGQGCTVEEKVRLLNCVVMDNVTIATGSVLQVLARQMLGHHINSFLTRTVSSATTAP